MNSVLNIRKAIFYLQQAIRNDYSKEQELEEGYKSLNTAMDMLIEELHAKNLKEIKTLDIHEIAKTYHDRELYAITYSGEQECPICSKVVTSLISIEHDSKDFSKDLSICTDCYTEIHNIWKTNTPKKICPV